MYEDFIVDENHPGYVEPPTAYNDDLEELGDSDLSKLIVEQLKLIQRLQLKAADAGIGTAELREIASTCSNLITGVNRTGELVKTIETYRLFVSAVLSWIKQLPEEQGQSLLEHLNSVANTMGVQADVVSLG